MEINNVWNTRGITPLFQGYRQKGITRAWKKMYWYYELRILGSLNKGSDWKRESFAYDMKSLLGKVRFRDELSYLLAISYRGEIKLLIFKREDISVNLKQYTLHAASSNFYYGTGNNGWELSWLLSAYSNKFRESSLLEYDGPAPEHIQAQDRLFNDALNCCFWRLNIRMISVQLIWKLLCVEKT